MTSYYETAAMRWHVGDCQPSRSEPYWYSRGGASLQACVLVLLFAAAVEGERKTCDECLLWHHETTPCDHLTRPSTEPSALAVGDLIAAMYDGRPYLGRVACLDDDGYVRVDGDNGGELLVERVDGVWRGD